MRLGIDGGCWSNRRGYGRFTRELLTAVARRDRASEFILFLDSNAADEFPVPRRLEVRRVSTSAAVNEAARADGRRRVGDLWRMARAVAQQPLDAFFFPSVYSYFPLSPGVPVIVGVHDTIAERRPELTFASRKHELFWRIKVWMALARADRVLTVSEYSRRSIHEYYRVPLSRIHVVSEGVAPVFRKMPVDPPARPFILYAGGISPHKNLSTLIAAYERIRARRPGVQLILVGDYQSDHFKSCYAELREQVRCAGLLEDVIFAGYVPDEELCRLYNSAALFVMPSLDEGFGLPALEAMTCGAPVVVSSGNALEEVVGDAGLVVAPNDVAALAEAMDRVLGDPLLAQQLSERGLRRSRAFSWDRAAEAFLEVVRSMVNPPPTPTTAGR
ncbi:MAG: glycosyltransferase family 1 protein [Bryobacterales bacterium]|nr:glycosyltransferase family 4 protein [Bryobacteraceae bacterium]MDW8354260.1 glycosyltransferase family 1 protein [Bryobacterales bacterium]